MALKAALDYYGIERRTRSLVDLLDELVPMNEKFKVFQQSTKILDQYYIPTRYANAFASGAAKRYYTESQANQAIESAKSIVEEVKKVVTEGRT